MQTQTLDSFDGPFMIAITIAKGDAIDRSDLSRFIEQLGGVKAAGGFTFPTATQRTVAMDLIADKYGSRYVTALRAEAGRESKTEELAI